MAGFFSKLFGKNTNGGAAPRHLSHPRDLRQGDFLKLKFLDQDELSNKEFEVYQINTYIYGEMCYPELVLKDRDGTVIFLMVEEEDGEEYLAFSHKIKQFDINSILGDGAKSTLLDGDVGTALSIGTPLDNLDDWMTQNYRKSEHNIRGSFVKGDARYLSDEAIEKREWFTSHSFDDNSEFYAIEIECYDSGETELCVTIYHPFSAIDEMWPSQTMTTP